MQTIYYHIVLFKRFIGLLAFMLFCGLFASAQSSLTDTLKTSLFNTTPDINKVKGFNKKNRLKKDSPVGFHGTIGMEAQMASQSYQYQQVPKNYIRWTILPEITLWGLPFKSLINLTTEQGKVNYNLNRFNLSLDVKQFQKILVNRLKERVKDSVDQTLFDSRKWEDSLQKLKVSPDKLTSLKNQLETDSIDITRLKEKLPKVPKPEVTDSAALKEYREASENYRKKKEEYKEGKRQLDSLLVMKEKYEQLHNEYEMLKKNGVFDQNAIKQYAGHRFPDKYKNHPYISRGQRFLLSIRNFSLGTIYPGSASSPYTQGMAVKGIAIENGFGKIYTSISAGLLEQQLNFGILKQRQNPLYIYTLKAGYGMPENTHLHAGIIKTGYVGHNKPAKETENNIIRAEPGTIYDLDGCIYLHENVSVSGYWALAENSENQFYKSTELPVTNNKYDVRDFASRSNTTWSASADGNLNHDKTRITAQLLRVGSGFNSTATPFLRNDLFRQEVKLSQKLYKNFISISASYRKDKDNLLNQKQYTTALNNYKASATLRLKKLPSFTFSYNRIEQVSNNKSFRIATLTGIYSITSVYNRRIKTKTLTSSLTLLHQTMNVSSSNIQSKYSGATLSAGIINQKGNGINYTSTVSVNQRPLNNTILNNQLEGFYAYEKNTAFVTAGGVIYTADNLWGNNGGAYIKQTLSFWKKNRIAVCLKENLFKRMYDNSLYFQTIVNFQIIQQW